MRYANTRSAVRQNLVQLPGVGKYGIPEIMPEAYEPCDFIPFNFAKTCKDRKSAGDHFFIDDYQFERVWNDIPKYTRFLCDFKAVMTPDFSLYTDYPVAVQIYNHYRKHLIGAYMQRMGIKVYPTIAWSDEKSYEWCFDGEPMGGTVCVSSVGTQRQAESKRLFLSGYAAMMERLQPETVLFYGAVPDGCAGNIIPIKPFTTKFREEKSC